MVADHKVGGSSPLEVASIVLLVSDRLSLAFQIAEHTDLWPSQGRRVCLVQ